MKIEDLKHPQAISYEKMVLASALNSETAREEMVTMLTVSDFYAREHRSMFVEIEKIQKQGNEPEYILFADSVNVPESYLTEVWYTVATNRSIRKLAPKLKRATTLRRQMAMALEILGNVSNADNSGFKSMLDENRRIIKKEEDDDAGKTGLLPVSEYAPLAVRSFERALDGKTTGIPIGFSGIDSDVGGVYRGEYTIIAGRPADGKSSFAVSIMRNIGFAGHNVGFYSLEMPAVKIVNKLVSIDTAHNGATVSGAMIRGRVRPTKSGLNQYMASMETVAGCNRFFIDESPSTSISDVESGLRSFIRKNDLAVVILDYMSLLRYDGPAGMPRHLQIAEMSNRLRALFKALNVAGIVLVQLKRETQGKKPTMADLRESGSLEQDANTIFAVYTPNPQQKQEKMVLTLKARDGDTNEYLVDFSTQTTEFTYNRPATPDDFVTEPTYVDTF